MAERPKTRRTNNANIDVELTDLRAVHQEGQHDSEKLLAQDNTEQVQPATGQTSVENRSRRANHFDYLDGYRGLCALLVVLQHSVGHMRIPNDYTVVYILGSYMGVYGFFVLSAFLLTYRFIQELDTKLDQYSEPADLEVPSQLRQQQRTRRTSCLAGLFDQLKIFSLVTLKYALRRFFRIYVSLIVFTRDKRTIFLQNLGSNHLWTMPTEIKYYFCIPIIGLLAVKTKKFSLVWFFLGFFLVILNEKLQVLKFEGGFGKPMGGSLISYFTVFFSGSLVAIVYYFNLSSSQKVGLLRRQWNKVPSCSCPILHKLSFLVFLRKVLTKPAKNMFWSAISFLFFIIFYTHYGQFWNGHSLPLPTDELLTRLGLKPFRLIDHMNAGIPSALLILLMLRTAPTTFTNMFAKSSVLTSYGKYSYGIYLWHIHVLYKIVRYRSFFKSDGLEILLAECILSYLYGFGFYYLVENPLMNAANFLCKKLDSLKCLRVK